MKLAAIYNIFDGDELLGESMRCMDGHVDLFILVYQNVSNFGEHHEPTLELGFGETITHKYDPLLTGSIHDGTANEIKKRNIGLEIAREAGCSHFLFVDCDEFYQDFGRAKRLYFESRKAGSVCSIVTYFGSPTLQFADKDNYWVPFVHELNKDTVAGYRKYPFYVDPTRRVNERHVAELPVIMHHYSWVRKDIDRKMRNSSAKSNMERLKRITEDCKIAYEGMTVPDMSNRKLVEVPDFFNLKPIFQ